MAAVEHVFAAPPVELEETLQAALPSKSSRAMVKRLKVARRRARYTESAPNGQPGNSSACAKSGKTRFRVKYLKDVF